MTTTIDPDTQPRYVPEDDYFVPVAQDVEYNDCANDGHPDSGMEIGGYVCYRCSAALAAPAPTHTHNGRGEGCPYGAVDCSPAYLCGECCYALEAEAGLR